MMRRSAWRVAHTFHGDFPRGRVRTLCTKDVHTLNKEAIALKMTNELYTYLLQHTREPGLLQKLRIETSMLRGARMQISPEQGQFMAMIARLIGAKTYLEVGVFTGYSLLSVMSVLPSDGQAVALDRDSKSLAVAKKFVGEAGLSNLADFRTGPANETLKGVREDYGVHAFDIAFIDADKRGYKEYFEFLMTLVRPGGLIMIDNVLWYGKVADAEAQDNVTEALRRLNAELLEDERIDFSIVPVGDGLSMCRIKET